MIIQSRNFVGDIKSSGIDYNGKMYNSLPGFNIYTITNENIILNNFQLHDDVIIFIKEQLATDIKYIVGLIDRKISPSFDVQKLVAGVPELCLDTIVGFVSGSTYFFLFDNVNKKLVSEKISKGHLVAETYKYENTMLIKIPNKYVVCADRSYPYFKEYIDFIVKAMELIFIKVTDVNSYEYINDPNEIYIFAHGPYPINKLCHKKYINFEQMTISAVQSCIKTYKNAKIPIIDYSIENTKYNKSAIYLPYQYDPDEINKLRKYYDTVPKIYDVAFVGGLSIRRKKIINALKKIGIKVLVVTGWGDARDIKIASCKILLNIHYAKNYNIYESLRCDRWAFAQMPVISEDSPFCSLLDVKKHNLVNFCPYAKLVGVIHKLLHNLKQPSAADIKIVKKTRQKIFNNLIVENKI